MGEKTGQVAVITGATGSIGSAISEKLLDAGFRVCLTDKEKGRLNDLLNSLRRRFDASNVLALEMDVERIDLIEKAERVIRETWGGTDVLVNNAGIFQQKSFLELDEDQFFKVINVNLLGAFRVSRVFVRCMMEKRKGKVVNIASIAAVRAAPKAIHYAASKAAMLALSRTMAVELAEYNVQVNTILPGYIETDMMGAYNEPLKKIASWRIPMKRLGTSDEVGEVVRLLASTSSTYLTGSEIIVDGGMTLV